MKKKNAAQKLLTEALSQVTSESVKAWATNEHNRPIWLQIAATYVGTESAARRLATNILVNAIGL